MNKPAMLIKSILGILILLPMVFAGRPTPAQAEHASLPVGRETQGPADPAELEAFLDGVMATQWKNTSPG